MLWCVCDVLWYVSCDFRVCVMCYGMFFVILACVDVLLCVSCDFRACVCDVLWYVSCDFSVCFL